ncbi:MAG: ATP--guanido phosphotransferase [Elusimicrobiota bacterium]
MILGDLAKRKISWVNGGGIVLSTRARIARNLHDRYFPSRADASALRDVFDCTVSAVSGIPQFSDASVLKLNALDRIDRHLLMERHLISHEMASLKRTTDEQGVVFTSDEKVSIMINEEDHIRIQCLLQGLATNSAYLIASGTEDSLGNVMKFAYSRRYGFLTSCPTNVGTGLRISCLLHLPAMVLTDSIENLLNGIRKARMVARGFYGEGTKPIGDIFQISNSTTLGATGEEIVHRFDRVVRTITRYETEARRKLLKESKHKLEDMIYRAYGILEYARSISSEEAILCLTKIRLCSDLNINLPVNSNHVDQLIFILQPGHLQEISNRALSPEERDIERTRLIRERLFGTGDIKRGKQK